MSTDRPQNAVAAGDTIKFTAKITNKGPGVAGQVRATLKGDDPFFDGREFAFGRIKPGETRTFTVPVKLPKDALTRIDPLSARVVEEHGAQDDARYQRAAGARGRAAAADCFATPTRSSTT